MLSVIIPNYNGSELLKKNIPFILKELKKIPKYELIIVDNNSTDNSKRIINMLDHNIIFLSLPENYGFVHTCNYGAIHTSNPFIMFLNNDMIPEKDFFSILLAKIKNTSYFAVTPLVLYDKTKTINASLGKIKINKKTKQIKFSYEQNLEKLKKDEISKLFHGGSAILNKKIFFNLGGFDKIYAPMYKESHGLSIKAQKHGYKILFTPQAIIYHAHRSTANKVLSDFFINYLIERNQNLLEWSFLKKIDIIKNISIKLKNLTKDLHQKKYTKAIAFISAFIKKNI